MRFARSYGPEMNPYLPIQRVLSMLNALDTLNRAVRCVRGRFRLDQLLTSSCLPVQIVITEGVDSHMTCAWAAYCMAGASLLI